MKKKAENKLAKFRGFHREILTPPSFAIQLRTDMQHHLMWHHNFVKDVAVILAGCLTGHHKQGCSGGTKRHRLKEQTLMLFLGVSSAVCICYWPKLTPRGDRVFASVCCRVKLLRYGWVFWLESLRGRKRHRVLPPWRPQAACQDSQTKWQALPHHGPQAALVS